MRLFVYEWTCCVPDAPPSLRREGWAMLWAVLRDFQKTRQIETVTLVHESFEHLPPGEVLHCRTPAEEEGWFRDLAASADGTLVIAPETGGCLLERVQWVEEVGGRLLGCNSRCTAVAGDKSQMGFRWRECGIRTPHLFAPGGTIIYPVVVKPRDGAGSQATSLVHNATELQNALDAAGPREMVIQQYVPGQAASVAFLFGPGRCVPLPPAAQHLSADGHFHYEGGTVPLAAPLDTRAARLGRQAVDVLAFHGYVGIDLVLGDDADGSDDYAIEINPRLTTSYLGLSALCEVNLAALMVRIALFEPDAKQLGLRLDIGKLRWRPEVIRFHPNGSLEIWPASR
jgi:predicted ATP-grasp superfamily ATP-dependent carboligase